MSAIRSVMSVSIKQIIIGMTLIFFFFFFDQLLKTYEGRTTIKKSVTAFYKLKVKLNNVTF